MNVKVSLVQRVDMSKYKANSLRKKEYAERENVSDGNGIDSVNDMTVAIALHKKTSL
jgi:hypothetical protein